MSRLKYSLELKQLLLQIREKYHVEGLEQTLSSIFKQNFSYAYDNLNELGL